MTRILEIFQAGGFVMYPLAICSLLTWAIALERIWWVRKAQKENKNLAKDLASVAQKPQIQAALQEACLRSRAPIAGILEEVFRSHGKTETLADKAQRRRQELNHSFKGQIWLIGTIGSATPFLGLFGTVVGILRAFHQISISGETGFAVVAAGISEALIATAAGIIVAVIAVAFYNYLQVIVGRLVGDSRLLMEEALELWQSKG